MHHRFEATKHNNKVSTQMETQNVPDIIDSAVIGRPSPFIHSLSVSQSLILRYNSYAKKLNFKMSSGF